MRERTAEFDDAAYELSPYAVAAATLAWSSSFPKSAIDDVDPPRAARLFWSERTAIRTPSSCGLVSG